MTTTPATIATVAKPMNTLADRRVTKNNQIAAAAMTPGMTALFRIVW